MQECDWQPTGETDRFGRPYHVCMRCDRGPWPFTKLAAPIPCKIQPGGPRGLGDKVAAVIKAVAGFFGQEIKPCGGCKERQRKLNRLG